MIYLDHAATAFPRARGVAGAVATALDIAGSAGRGAHGGARQAGSLVDECRARAADLLGGDDPRRVVIFPSSTLALSTAIADLCLGASAQSTLLIGPLEHNAVWRPAVRGLSEERVLLLPSHTNGLVDSAALETLDPAQALGVVVQHASNVSGLIQPIEEIGAWCSKHGLPLLVDGAQAAGIVPTVVERIPALRVYTTAGHKFLGGPPGIGLCWLAPGYEPEPLWIGGNGVDSELSRIPAGGPGRFESGTPNLPGIAGLAAALRTFDDDPPAARFSRLAAIRKVWVEDLSAIEGIEICGEGGPGLRTPVISLQVAGFDPNEAAALLDERIGARCRAGLHCAPLAHRHLGTFPEGSLRIAAGEEVSDEKRGVVIAALAELCREGVTGRR